MYQSCPNDWGIYNLSVDSEFKLTQKQLNNIEKDTIEFHQESIELFNRFLDQCKADKIQVILILSPELYINQQLTHNRAEMLEKIKFFANKYNLEFWDYSKHPLSMNKDYHFDLKHMNTRGADMFSKEIAKRILPYKK